MHISLKGVSKRFSSVEALAPLSLEIAPGEIVAVLGANGAGKSTLLRLLGGILIPTRGTIEMDGHVFGREEMDLRRRLAFLPEFAPVYPSWTPLQHIAMLLRLYEKDQDPSLPQRIVELLRELDLLAVSESPMNTLSRGQMYKAALAGLLAVDPDLWILDEPFATGMDSRGLSAFRRHCQEASKRGRTILYSTQLVEVVESLATRVCVINKGRLAAWESLSSLRTRCEEIPAQLARWLDQDPAAEESLPGAEAATP
jgi:ABC-2 type transport system ATP-binding protein